MERQPLDGLEYESSYLELRPDYERLSDTTDASLPARRRGDVPVHDAVPSYGIALADTEMVRARPRTIPAPPLYLCPRTVVRAHASRRPAGPPVGLLRRSTHRAFSAVRSDQQPSRHRARYWTLLGPGLLVAVSASLGIVAELDVRAARSLFVALTAILLLLGAAGLARDAASATIRRRRSPSAGSLRDRSRDVLRDRALGGVRASGFCCVLKDGRARDGWDRAHHWPSRSGAPHVI